MERAPVDRSPLSAGHDAYLLGRVRVGDMVAYQELYTSNYGPALAFARTLTDTHRADDLVAEAFVRVYGAIRDGKGPTRAVRPYLLTTIRNLHRNAVRAESRVVLVDDYGDVPTSSQPTVDHDHDLEFDRQVVHRAFSSLPLRWRTVLWLTAVDGVAMTEIAARLGISPNAAAQLSYRAREGLRRAFLREHLAVRTVAPQCAPLVGLLPAAARDGGTSRQRQRVEDHLAGCASCTDLLAMLTAANRVLAAAPLTRLVQPRQ